MTTETITADFVADARNAYVPAIRWLRANGWDWRNGKFQHRDKRLNLEWNEGSWRGGTPYVTVNTTSEHGSLVRCPLMVDVETCRQAVDYLVTAGVLPTEFHSLAITFTEITADDSLDQLERGCAADGHPLAIYDRVRNDSVCLCGQACELGDFRTARATS